MSLADTISSMPSVESTTRTGYSNVSNFSSRAKPPDMTSVITEPPSVSSFISRANGSLTKAPPKAVPSPTKTTIQPPTPRISAMERPVTVVLARSPEKTPIIRSASAPAARISSGAARIRLWERSAVIVLALLDRHSGLGGLDGKRDVVDEGVDRCRRHLEDRHRIDAEQDDEEHQRVDDGLLARREVEQALQAFLGQRPEDDAAIEPQRVGRRQDDAGGGEECDPGVDPEHAKQGQELADEAGSARQADIGHGEDQERDRIFRHVVDEAAIGVDLAGVHAVVDDADAQEQRARDETVGKHL